MRVFNIIVIFNYEISHVSTCISTDDNDNWKKILFDNFLQIYKKYSLLDSDEDNLLEAFNSRILKEEDEYDNLKIIIYETDTIL